MTNADITDAKFADIKRLTSAMLGVNVLKKLYETARSVTKGIYVEIGPAQGGSTLDIVNGQSGNIFDEHYNDQWDAYYHGRSFALPFSPDSVQKAAAHHLRLDPQ